MPSKPTVIDGLEFARSGKRLSGQLKIAELDRLADGLVSNSGGLEWTLLGQRSEGQAGQFELKLAIAGALQLRCQRCLEPLLLLLEIDKRLLLVAPGKDWPEEDAENESVDAVAASTEMAVDELIQDEVLLGLPIAPRHDDCDPPTAGATKQDASPFAILQQLKRD